MQNKSRGGPASKKITEKIFSSFLNKSGKEKITIIVLIGVLLLVVSLPVKKNNSTAEEASLAQSTSGQRNGFSADEPVDYEDYIETKLKGILTQVEGVGKVNVVVTLKSTSEKILATDDSYSQEQLEETDSSGGSRSSSTTSGSSTNIFYDTSQGSQPYVKLENMPEVEGIIIVAQGGGDGTVASNITSAVEALLGVPAHKIKVLKMS